VQVLGSEVQQVGVAAHFLLHGTVALVMLAIHIALAVALAPQLAIAAIVLLCPAAILGWRLMPRIRRLGAAVIVDHEHMTGETMRFLDGLKAAAAHNMQPAFVAEHRRLSDAALANRRDFFRVQARSRHLTSAAVALAGAAAVLLGATALRLDPAVLIVLIVILARTGTPALLLQQSAEQIAHCLPAFAAAQAMEAECGTRRPFPPAHRIPRHGTGPSLLFDRVTFLHPAREGAHPGGIRQVDAMVPAGALIGIAGPSGAGKTSFVDLAAGLLMPHEGAVLIDGVRLTPDRLAIHRDRIGYAGRDPFLFGGTFRHNLLWGTPERSDDAILEALDRVGAAQLVRSRGGLDARIDEHRLTLSAGEGQRLAIARLLLRAAPLLILDEATASLDIGSERRALHALRESLCRPTILLVSHRAETLAQCDAVLRFDAGALAPATEPLSVARASTA
jgi:ATP-binding cassette subfamily C protein